MHNLDFVPPALAAVLPLFAVLLLTARGQKAFRPQWSRQAGGPATAISSPDEPPAPSSSIVLSKAFGRRSGDLDGMVKSRKIRYKYYVAYKPAVEQRQSREKAKGLPAS